jgi:hypothetical protein
MALGLAAGLMADGIGLKRSMIVGLLILFAASFLGGWAQDVPALLALRALEGLGLLLACMPASGLIRQLENTFFALVLPFMAFQTSQASVVYFQHTHPKIPWFAQGDARHQRMDAEALAAHIDMPRLVSSWVHHAYCHAAHHVCPSIPCYRLYDAQRRLNELLRGQGVKVAFRLSAILDIFRRCKLYDYDAHRWLDFEGNATSPMLLDDDGRMAPFDDIAIAHEAAAATSQRRGKLRSRWGVGPPAPAPDARDRRRSVRSRIRSRAQQRSLARWA